MSKHQKILIIIALLIAAFLAGFIFGFGYIAENPFEAFRLETWRTFFQQLRSF
ncbi:DNA-directed RNA polymerase subunit beta [Natranaerobius trueperi]|nr:DNA-directed RNA polymerase subunit beta [Natranaerobius trueperi]